MPFVNLCCPEDSLLCHNLKGARERGLGNTQGVKPPEPDLSRLDGLIQITVGSPCVEMFPAIIFKQPGRVTGANSLTSVVGWWGPKYIEYTGTLKKKTRSPFAHCNDTTHLFWECFPLSLAAAWNMTCRTIGH
uniref:Uncharacterized protein n=1 Tax=Micrurus lemniscatus lemniscatus TaxID=129467 RepID=A0A2D4I079_MICLE